MRRIIHLIVLLSLLALPAALWAQTKAKGNLKPTVPAPKWKDSVLKAFFTDASQELVGEPPGASDVASSSGGNTTVPGGEADPAAGGDGYAWHTLISPETIEGEIKTSTTLVGEAVATKNKFTSGGCKIAQRNYSVMAVMFGVAARYDGEVKWKDKAAGLRDELAKAGFNCKVNTDQAYNGAKARYEEMAQLLRGDSVKVPEPGDEPTWPQVSDRPPLMQRLEESKNKLNPWTASSADFKANKEEILREAQVLAILARVIQDASYEFADDTSYQEYAAALQQGAMGVLEALTLDDADAAQKAMGMANKACDDCHGGFR